MLSPRLACPAQLEVAVTYQSPPGPEVIKSLNRDAPKSQPLHHEHLIPYLNLEHPQNFDAGMRSEKTSAWERQLMVWGQTLGFRVQGSGHGKRRLQSSYLSYSEGAGVSVRSQRTHIAIDLGLFWGAHGLDGPFLNERSARDLASATLLPSTIRHVARI